MSRPFHCQHRIDPQEFFDRSKEAAAELDVTARMIQNWQTGGGFIPRQGLSVDALAWRSGIPAIPLLRFVETGRIIGARKNPLSKEWWIYPPAKLLTGRPL